MPRGSAPGERRGGRQAGAPNVLPDLRAITLKALMKAGGVDYLVRQSEENPMGFLSLLGRVMPRESHVELSGEVKMRQEVRRDLVDKVIVLMQAPAIDHDAPKPAIDGTASPLPAITHNPDTMLRAQVSQDRDRLTRRGEEARRESAGTVNAAVHRAEAMHRERPVKGVRMAYEREAANRIDGVRTASGNGSDDSSMHADSSADRAENRAGGTLRGAPTHADARPLGQHGPPGLLNIMQARPESDSPGESS